jgi:hypothetical protein
MNGKQKAGKNSTQINSLRDTNIFSAGVSINEVRDIVKTEIEQVLSNFKFDALEKYLAYIPKICWLKY